jgi:hypothetical protein
MNQTYRFYISVGGCKTSLCLLDRVENFVSTDTSSKMRHGNEWRMADVKWVRTKYNVATRCLARNGIRPLCQEYDTSTLCTPDGLGYLLTFLFNPRLSSRPLGGWGHSPVQDTRAASKRKDKEWWSSNRLQLPPSLLFEMWRETVLWWIRCHPSTAVSHFLQCWAQITTQNKEKIRI